MLRPVGREIAAAAVGGRVAHGEEFAPVVDEACCQNLAILQIGAVFAQAFIAQVEGIALAQIENEIDVPAEDRGEFQDGQVLQSGGVAGVE